MQFLNLSLLTSDFYSAAARVLFFGGFSTQAAFSFSLSCIIVVAGLVLYFTAPESASHRDGFHSLGNPPEPSLVSDKACHCSNNTAQPANYGDECPTCSICCRELPNCPGDDGRSREDVNSGQVCGRVCDKDRRSSLEPMACCMQVYVDEQPSNDGLHLQDDRQTLFPARNQRSDMLTEMPS
jgi:hypothetical protein